MEKIIKRFLDLGFGTLIHAREVKSNWVICIYNIRIYFMFTYLIEKSLLSEFPEERKQILEVVGPELQTIYDDMGIEVKAFDRHFIEI